MHEKQTAPSCTLLHWPTQPYGSLCPITHRLILYSNQETMCLYLEQCGFPRERDCLDRASQSILMRKELHVAQFAHTDLRVCVPRSSQSSVLDIFGWSYRTPPWTRTVFQARQMSLEEGVSQEYDKLAYRRCTHRHTTYSSTKQAETSKNSSMNRQ